DGKPVDAFMGVRPESEVRAFFEKHAGPPAGIDMEKILADARELIAQSDFAAAMDLLTAFLQSDPQNPEALALLASVYLKNNDVEHAENLFASIDENDHNKPDVAAIKAELELISQANDLQDIQQLILAVEKDDTNFQAKFDLSLAYNAAGKREEAADVLLEIIVSSREWNEDGARKQLLKYFEAWGPTDEATNSGRRKLSTLLFS
ncbi:FIG000875: Thioredoxin domain-containing protein EC-YbbN, partial [hydrothermal vent metagenome]